MNAHSGPPRLALVNSFLMTVTFPLPETPAFKSVARAIYFRRERHFTLARM